MNVSSVERPLFQPAAVTPTVVGIGRHRNPRGGSVSDFPCKAQNGQVFQIKDCPRGVRELVAPEEEV